ncbi:MAG: serine--tRNA ligase [Micrococcaceae bacterium]
MINLADLRENPEHYRNSQKLRGADIQLVDDIIKADTTRRETLQEFEAKRAEQKTFGKKIAKAPKSEKQELVKQVGSLAKEVKRLDASANEAQKTLDELLFKLDNLVEDGVPAGGEDDFEVVRKVGDIPEFDFEVKDHLEIGEAIDGIDMTRGAKVSGARFYFLKGDLMMLEQAMFQLGLQRALAAGFVPMTTPTLVLPQTMAGTGFLGEHADEVYHLEEDDLYLVGTSEVALAGYHANEILNFKNGFKRYAGLSSCYRREAGSYGKDTRGIIRVHQFNKLEMFSYVPVEDATKEHEKLLAMQEEMLQDLGLSYRVINTAAGDLGSSAAKKYDCEAWIPTQQTYRELTSTSNCTTFQARRLKIRERTENGTCSVATLNGTLATTRWLVALLETHQNADGSVNIPEVLQPFMGGKAKIDANRS